MFKVIAISCLVYLLTACGFQLRGSEAFDLAQQSIYLKADNSNLSSALINALEDNNALLIDDINAADLVLEISNQSFNQTPSAYDASANIIEYALTYSVSIIVKEQAYRFNATENYAYSSEQVLATDNNRILAEENLIEQAVRFILNSLAN